MWHTGPRFVADKHIASLSIGSYKRTWEIRTSSEFLTHSTTLKTSMYHTGNNMASWVNQANLKQNINLQNILVQLNCKLSHPGNFFFSFVHNTQYTYYRESHQIHTSINTSKAYNHLSSYLSSSYNVFEWVNA